MAMVMMVMVSMEILQVVTFVVGVEVIRRGAWGAALGVQLVDDGWAELDKLVGVDTILIVDLVGG